MNNTDEYVRTPRLLSYQQQLASLLYSLKDNMCFFIQDVDSLQGQCQQRPRCRRPWWKHRLSRWTAANRASKAGQSYTTSGEVGFMPFLDFCLWNS